MSTEPATPSPEADDGSDQPSETVAERRKCQTPGALFHSTVKDGHLTKFHVDIPKGAVNLGVQCQGKTQLEDDLHDAVEAVLAKHWSGGDRG